MLKLKYRQKLFFYLTAIFLVFTMLVLFLQYNREKSLKREQMEMNLDNIAELTFNYIEKKNLDPRTSYSQLDSLYYYIPTNNIRITIINMLGKVLYDTEVSDPSKMENHLHRPEIQFAQKSGTGSHIRESSTTGYEYYYYAKNYENLFVRVAAHYDVEVKNFLDIEKTFLLYLLVLFMVTWGILSLVLRNISGVLLKLKDFATKLSQGKEIEDKIHFPEGEFGEISNQIIEIYNKLTAAKGKIEIEKNKMFSHLIALNEGIAFFTPEKKKILRNNHFIQFINNISKESKISEEEIFNVKEFRKLNTFLDSYLDGSKEINKKELPHFEDVVYRDKKTFNLHAIVFSDRSFEVVIRDITKLEKQKIIKEQITSNIAHELKTPITIILGYLELLNNNDISKEDAKKYISNAYAQSERLSDLIEDISLLQKMSEAKERFSFETVNLNDLIYEVKDSLALNLQAKNGDVKVRLPKPIILNANRSLLFSVFYNLFDNAIKYGGENIEISVNNYLEDSNYYYFSFSNTGATIEKKHFLRIFERFYRVDEDRSRVKGGTGLGLAIVKNAIQLHGGEITAGNHKNGGVEFLFTLSKSL
ncbi:MAG: ATP-binding protein [Lutimonas sp.]